MSFLHRIFTARRVAAATLLMAPVGSAPITASATDATDQSTSIALIGIMRNPGKEMEAVTDARARTG